ncbi:MAG: hypothetical protein A2542_00510 [Parcubacteria group bacterium RIFOXYD2_FULL_52_8]|nr:MAG: hypothetical protein A2542_00510 [Parcubacteria group bacterium RIFOXYD2_FULL_52_8]
MSSWGRQHQTGYLLAIIIVVLVAGVGTYVVRKPVPTCGDGVENGSETGVDCGGACLRACKDEATAPIVSWVHFFPVRSGAVDVAALLRNPNARFALSELRYRFKLYDANQQLIAERDGVTFLNPGEETVIFEPLVQTKSRVAARAFLELAPQGEDLFWVRKGEERVPALVVKDKEFALDPVPSLTVTLGNTSSFDARDVSVVGVLYDGSGNAVAASATTIPRILRLQESESTLTWPNPFSVDIASSGVYLHTRPLSVN